MKSTVAFLFLLGWLNLRGMTQNFVTVNLNDCWVCGAAYNDLPKDIKWVFNKSVSAKDVKFLTDKYGIQQYEINDLIWRAYHIPAESPSLLHDAKGDVLCEVKHYNTWLGDQHFKSEIDHRIELQFNVDFSFPDSIFLPGANYLVSSGNDYFVFNKNEGRVCRADPDTHTIVSYSLDDSHIWKQVYHALGGDGASSDFFFRKYAKLKSMGMPVFNVKSIGILQNDLAIFSKFLFNKVQSDTLKTTPVMVTFDALLQIKNAYPVGKLPEGFAIDDGAFYNIGDTLILPVYKDRANEPCLGKFILMNDEYQFSGFHSAMLPVGETYFPSLSNGFEVINNHLCYDIISGKRLDIHCPDSLNLVSIFKMKDTYAVFQDKEMRNFKISKLSPDFHPDFLVDLPWPKSNFVCKGNRVAFIDSNDRILLISDFK